MAYIYIAWDKNKPNICKIGKTKRSAQLRVSETENPDYQLYKSYNVLDDVVDRLEKDIHGYMSARVTRIKHQTTGRLSEWFNCSPTKAVELVSDCLISHLVNKLDSIGASYGLSPNYNQTNSQSLSTTLLKEKLKMNLSQRRNGELSAFVRETIQKK
ncbi:GIY-YIG nuclease family protein [Vibrio cholerae]|nr:GIY-YIG nuclease family protein [Vibrio cholerae]EGR3967552.1 GIY-YIG nuclease family protein [Vibrio cholerae]